MIGNDTALDSGIGVCGKEGQSVPVGVGQPTLRIDAGLTVGGSRNLNGGGRLKGFQTAFATRIKPCRNRIEIRVSP